MLKRSLALVLVASLAALTGCSSAAGPTSPSTASEYRRRFCWMLLQ
jgi:curli biogenesis system outer membrane secretion channel CsgG